MADVKDEPIKTQETNTIDYMKFPKLSALFGQAETAEQPDAEQASMEAAEAKLAEMGDTIAVLNKAIEVATSENAALTQTVSELRAQIETLTNEHTAAKSYIAEVEKKLEAAPAGAATQVARETDPGHENELVSKFYSESDEMLAQLKAKLQPQN
jgi:FtsZ-binding cell division protein ZapB